MREFISREPVEKGWSGDRKYRVTAADGSRYLLRVSPADKAEKIRGCFRMQQEVSALGIPMCQPVEAGECEDGVYTLQSWIEGRDAKDVIPSLPEAEQYRYGLDAGRILAKIHTIPAPEDLPDWEERFSAKIDRNIRMYEDCPVKFGGDASVLEYIADNRHLLNGRPQCFQHGDYHIGNMMIRNDGTLVIIDFDRFDFGDPWEEFNRIVWCAQASGAFASGIVDGYFEGDVPEKFWKLLALYICSNTLSSVPWAIPFGDREVRTMLDQAEDVMEWYDGMKRVIPSWYSERYR